MIRKHRNPIILVVIAALVGAAIYFVYPPGKKTHLGLDLQGGVEVVYEARTAIGGMPSSAQIDQTVTIINRRVNGLGVSEAAVQKQGQDQISVGLPGEKDAQHALALIGKTAQLQFFFDDAGHRPVGSLTNPITSRADLLKQAKGIVPAAQLAKLASGESSTKGYTIVEAPGSASQPGAFNNTKDYYFLYTLPPAMTGDAIKTARRSVDPVGAPDVVIDFTSKGGKIFTDVTRQLAVTGGLNRTNQTFAIVLDGVMESDPMVDYQKYPQGITGGSAEISGGRMTVKDANDLAFVLNTGALPVTLVQIQQRQVSATLGKDSLRAGLIAGGAGLLVVLIYLIVFYRFLGVIADIALIVYGVLLWGVFNAVPVTLTLPGIAGMILTIGVAADANVVIFERIKEEVRNGKTVRSAIASGYSRGFRTILDANVLTLLTAVVLFEFATAQPRGFAVTLILGVLVSMLTAVLATRALLGVLSVFPFLNRASFMGVSAAQMAAAAAAVKSEAIGGSLRHAPTRGAERRRETRAAAELPTAAPEPRAAAELPTAAPEPSAEETREGGADQEPQIPGAGQGRRGGGSAAGRRGQVTGARRPGATRKKKKRRR